MRRLSIIALSLLLISCELSQKQDEGKIYLISASLDYRNTSVSPLLCPNEDQRAVIDQFAYLCELMERSFASYALVQDGNDVCEWTMTRPLIGDAIDRRERFELASFKLRLRRLLDRVALVSDPEDLVIFYYAGHGVRGFDGEKEVRYLNGALVLGNIDFPEIGDWRTGDLNRRVLYPISELRSDMADIPGKKLLILDSCYSGEIVRDELEEKELSRMLSELMRPRRIFMDNIWELTGSRFDEKSYEEMYDDEVYHGRFTTLLLETLGYRYGEDSERPGSPSDGLITVYSLYRKIRERMDDRSQTPDTSSSMVDLVIFRHPGSVRTL